MPATIRAIQLRPIGIVSVATVTWAWLIRRSRCPIAKIPKRMLATRNPVFGEFTSQLSKLPGGCQYKSLLYVAVLRYEAACTIIPMIARATNTRVEPVGGNTIAL